MSLRAILRPAAVRPTWPSACTRTSPSFFKRRRAMVTAGRRHRKPVGQSGGDDGLAFAFGFQDRFEIVFFGNGDHSEIDYTRGLSMVKLDLRASKPIRAASVTTLVGRLQSDNESLRLTSIRSAPLTLSIPNYESSGHWKWWTRACAGLEAAPVSARFQVVLRAGQWRHRRRSRVSARRRQEVSSRCWRWRSGSSLI